MSVVELGRFMDDLAHASGKAIMPFFRAQFAMEDKARGGSPFDPVTEADRAAEIVLRAMIGRAFPGHGILGEEFGTERADAECVWVLDPIDGTRAFIAGIPTWGTLIGLTRNGVPVRGLMHQPYLGELFTGDGHTAKLRGPAGERTLRSRRCADLSQALLATTDPRLFAEGEEAERFRALEGQVRLSRYGTDCYAYCMLAAGQIDLVVEAGLKPYDICALIPIVEGAGGRVTGWDGGPAGSGGRVIAAGDPRLHEAALKVLNP
ncbi:histidinol-phosphatase [Methylobacterium persicinum]|uniref:Histidinol-phosphatase n=1 Tax=Methylobacterium persicinum TaxID=374426 RepID=A0ABU0HPQ5_9HYPH|nr:histidinol-phosphatase [Methylobacterium persicinum]MDQ0444309.1 myo-inositol-1(or 4)-monophosphatase [Methylobacterium persicinum]GJE36259.1 Histidinol-phosphatase [Methylobacterium persicinum]